ncbi:prolyl-tRNA editing protein [Haloprofundus marisrubri]|uniref:Prolyl-tRNA editing protein n=1 Tax=Haloprofundus marisrubri TaxID=1514971 RepID=A0A0W1RBN4_9EURY|nr:YbaK/EbsC family protein [Haloprofundus marisrubri]KTG10035.1 prolyl-tRNA editing protein [Haloprofundus marisrubri]
MHPRAQAFAERAADAYGLDVTVREFPEGTKTAADAADAIGCEVGQIASSLVFAVDAAVDGTDDTETLVVAVTSGANRVSEDALAAELGVAPEDVSMADPELIRERVGWAIGGVPPFCHDAEIRTFVDPTLLDYETVWAAAGTPSAVFALTPESLREHASATVADVITGGD